MAEIPLPVQIKAVEHLFWRKVDKRPDGCWYWTGATDGRYGDYNAGRSGKNLHIKAHRMAYLLLVGPIPEGHQLDHLCRNYLCVNPSHLEPVTQQENNRRSDSESARHARKTHCLRGHPLKGDNLRIKADGSRLCVTCDRWRQRKAWAAKHQRERGSKYDGEFYTGKGFTPGSNKSS
jgi:hypothetical protein